MTRTPRTWSTSGSMNSEPPPSYRSYAPSSDNGSSGASTPQARPSFAEGGQHRPPPRQTPGGAQYFPQFPGGGDNATENTPLFSGYRPDARSPPPRHSPPRPHNGPTHTEGQEWEGDRLSYSRGERKCLYMLLLWFFVVLLAVAGTLVWSNEAESLARCRDGTELFETRADLTKARASLASCGTERTILQKSVQQLESVNAVCEAENAHLNVSLFEANIKLDVLQASYDRCIAHESELEVQLEAANREEAACEEEKGELKQELQRHLIVEWMDWIKEFGTGGDSWICSDHVSSWSFGLATSRSPHTDLPIQVWYGEFHSKYRETFRAGERAVPPTAQIVGYKVFSRSQNGNGWWKKNGLDVFGAREVQFLARRPVFHEAKYRVEVYYVAESE